MSEEIVLIQWVSYEHLSSVFGLKGIDVATAALLENLFNFRLINMKGKKKEKIYESENKWLKSKVRHQLALLSTMRQKLLENFKDQLKNTG